MNVLQEQLSQQAGEDNNSKQEEQLSAAHLGSLDAQAQESDPEKRIQAVKEMGKNPQAFVETLTKLSHNDELGTRIQTTRAMSNRPDLFVEPLSKLAEDASAIIRSLVFKAMTTRPDLFAEAITRFAGITDGDPDRQSWAFRVIVDHPEFFVQPLTEMMGDYDPHVQTHAFEAIEKRPEFFVETISKWLVNDPYKVANDFVRRFVDRHPQLIVEVLCKRATAEDEEVRSWATEIMRDHRELFPQLSDAPKV